VYDIKLGFSRVPARDFYRVAHARCKAGGFKVPDPAFRKAKG